MFVELVGFISILFIITYSILWCKEFFKAPKSVRGKVIVITGSSAGIGEQLAKNFAKENTLLVLSARRKELLEKLQQECIKNGSEAKIFPADVSNEEDCRKLIEFTIEQFGRIDILVLNAGIGQSFFLEANQSDPQQFKSFLDVNFWGCVWSTYHALPHLRKSKGQIAVVSSVGGLLPFPRQTLYNASKHALEGFFNSLRIELSGSGVAITMLNPGFIQTNMTTGGAIGREGKPTKVNPKIKMMSSEDCALSIFKAISARKRSEIMPFGYRIFVAAYYFSPELGDIFMSKAYGRSKSPSKKNE